MTGASSIPGSPMGGAGDRRTREDAVDAAEEAPELALPRPPGVLRRFWAAHPRLVDILVVVVTGLPALVASIALGPLAQVPWWAAAGLVAAAAAASVSLLWRRRWPLLPVVVASVVSALPSPMSGGGVLPLVAALYALGAYAAGRTVWIGFGIAAASGVIANLVSTAPDDVGLAGRITSAVLAVLFALVAVLIGVSVGGRRRYVDSLVARARDLARERDQEAQLVAAAERARIAREMHDIVSHGLTVVVTLAEGAAAVTPSDPERGAETMRRVADTGRSALAEMRRLLGVLAEPGDSSPLTPQPGVGDLNDLVQRFRETGMPVRLATSGTVPADPGLGLAVHRIVQESLTNVLRHAPAATRVDVTVTCTDHEVAITVDDDAVAHAAPRTTGSGRGLIGMRERALMYGGTVDAGPRPSGGWRVHAVLHGEDDG
ncbi:sensor histidine kinase [Microbacterium cremeum]|uniref:sensor histidine kinase n=1 Tax=Microbacterium cremeum TaxID=2782169 RepID=UPI001889658F|nr:histidine kinase [Microbacterium cremeum]